MRLRFVLLAAALVLTGGMTASTAALAQDQGQGTVTQDTITDDGHPWSAAQNLLAATQTDVNALGIKGVEPHVADLEKALASAPDAIRAARGTSGPLYVLTDGPDDTSGLTGGDASRTVTTAPNPFPLIALYLGSYYDEVGRPDDAARVLDLGLAVYDMTGFVYAHGQHRSWLMLERCAAANEMKQFDLTLAITEKGLALDGEPPYIRAHFYRHRGFALTELNRLDDATDAYNKSLELVPGNQTALHELDYIARLKAGGEKEQGGLAPLPVPGKTQ